MSNDIGLACFRQNLRHPDNSQRKRLGSGPQFKVLVDSHTNLSSRVRITRSTDHPINRSSLLHPIFKFSRKIPMSLSPLPEIFTITISDFFIFGARLMHSATAWDDSSAGIIPSVRANRVHASSASVSDAATYSARFESASAACSGPIEG